MGSPKCYCGTALTWRLVEAVRLVLESGNQKVRGQGGSRPSLHGWLLAVGAEPRPARP